MCTSSSEYPHAFAPRFNTAWWTWPGIPTHSAVDLRWDAAVDRTTGMGGSEVVDDIGDDVDDVEHLGCGVRRTRARQLHHVVDERIEAGALTAHPLHRPLDAVVVEHAVRMEVAVSVECGQRRAELM